MARVNRIKAKGVAHYHVISRIANQAFLLKGAEIKDTVVNMLHRAADFSGVDVLSYVVMDNHFHLCVRVPEKTVVPEDEVLRRIGILYGEERMDMGDMGRIDGFECDHQLHAQAFSQPTQRFDRGVCISVFQFADIRLRDAGSLGKLLLAHICGAACINDRLLDRILGFQSIILFLYFGILKLFLQKIF